MEAAADVIAHPADSHRTKGFGGHAKCGLPRVLRGVTSGVLAQQEQQFRRTRKLRRIAEATVPFVECLDVAIDSDVERLD